MCSLSETNTDPLFKYDFSPHKPLELYPTFASISKKVWRNRGLKELEANIIESVDAAANYDEEEERRQKVFQSAVS